MKHLPAAVATILLVVALAPVRAEAQQTFEVVGSRALGMGGAFVAVADDPTSVFWNPAGLASGQPAGMTIEWVRFRFGDRDAEPTAGPWQRSAKFVSLGTWPIGMSYANFDETTLQENSVGGLTAHRFTTRHYGATVLQTLTQGLVVGATLKYVKGTVGEGPVAEATNAQALDGAAGPGGVSTSAFDIDGSVMFDARVFRVGWTVRNLRSPRFDGPAGTSMQLRRQSRVGLAILPSDGLIFAVDLDVDTADLPGGPSRMLAVGAERSLGRRVVVRSGARWNLKETRTVVGAVGASVSLGTGAWLDGHFTQGRRQQERGFSVALRAGW